MQNAVFPLFRCTYKSKWKWDVVKHLKRCGGGTVKDVIDTTKMNGNGNSNKGLGWVKALQFKESSMSSLPVQPGNKLSGGPPNVTVLPSGVVKPSNPTPTGAEQNLIQSPSSPQTPDHTGLMTFQRVDVPPPGSIGNGLYHCLHCPFVGNSPAELKRHTRVHSDEKPFSCLTCGYSSKWKCDLKKHLRTYNHASAVNLDTKSDGGDTYLSDDLQSPTEGSHDLVFDGVGQDAEFPGMGISGSQAKQLYECDKCPYATHKKNSLEAHMKIHSQPGQSMFTLGGIKHKCKQCDFETEDLPAFVQHKLTHNTVTPLAITKPQPDAEDEAVSPNSASYTDEVDVMGSPSKHRRKPVKQFRCTRCPYTCFKRSGLEQHQSMHEPREGSLVCKYCDYNVYSRSLLGQHMKLHPDYLQEVGDGTDDDDEEDMNEEEHADETFLSENRQNLTIKNSSVFPGQTEEERRYPCEWCDVTCSLLSELYQHAKAVHPAEYEQQEAAYSSMESSAEDNGLLSPVPSDLQSPNFPEANGKESDLFLNKPEAMRPGAPVVKRKRKLLTCPDCGYTTDNSANLARHAVKHGQNAMYQCHYCNYSLNRQGLVIAHMKQVHSVTVASLPKRSEVCDENDVSAGEAHKAGEDATEVEMASIKGESVLVLQMGNRKSFKCPKCAYTTANSSHCANHVRQHGSNKRYNCEFCDYSLDKLPHIIIHMKSAHSDQMNGGYQDAEEQKVQPLLLSLNGLDAKNYKSAHKINGNSRALAVSATNKKNGQAVRKVPQLKNKLVKKALAVFKGSRKNGAPTKRSVRKRMSCRLCPYQTTKSGLLQNHLLQHHAFSAV